jgi:hypothetical protein
MIQAHGNLVFVIKEPNMPYWAKELISLIAIVACFVIAAVLMYVLISIVGSW